MGKVMFAMNISIDGCYGHTHFRPDDELMEYFVRLMQETGIIVYGRKTYELMIPYWPEVAKNQSGTPGDIAFAKALMATEKYVLSRSLKEAAENAIIVNENPGGLIRKLKQQSRKTIAFSSTSLLPHMLELGLIDELNLIVHPVLVGENKRLFDHFVVPEKFDFELKRSGPFTSGAVALHYTLK